MILEFSMIRRSVFALVFAILSFNTSAFQTNERAAITVQEKTIKPGEKQYFTFLIDKSFDASFVNMPVYVANGIQTGHRLCVTAGIHGDEINGSVIASRAFSKIDPAKLHGTVIMLPMINSEGIRNNDRYMPDRRDLNRYFPGDYHGSIAAIVARATFDLITTHCDTLIDLHTGSFLRVNAPQIRVTSNNPDALTLARNFGSGIILFGDGPRGSLRREASEAGLSAIIYEAAGPHVLDLEAADVGVRGLMNVMHHLGMLLGDSPEIPDHKVYRHTAWERVPLGSGGFFFPEVTLGTKVKVGQRLGYLISPLDAITTPIIANHDGIIIGMAHPQIVLSGYALFHLGFEGTSGKTLTEKELGERKSINTHSDG